MRITRKNLAQLAYDCGCAVDFSDSPARVRITRSKSRDVFLYEDGTLLRADVRFDLARSMTVRDAVELLQIVVRAMTVEEHNAAHDAAYAARH